MSRIQAILVPLALVSLFVAGCTGSYCSEPEHQTEMMCQLASSGTVAGFTVAPARISLNKDSTTQVTISAYSNLINMLVTLTQPGGTVRPLAIGNVGTDGTLRATIRASDLANQGFLPGLAEVQIAGQKLIVRIFVAPKFDDMTFSAAQGVTNDQGTGNMAAPAWVGVQSIGNKKILTLNEYAVSTITKQAIGEYTYDPTNKLIKKASPLLFSAYNATPYMDMNAHGLALSMSDFVIPEFGNMTTSLITQCSLDGVCSGSTAAQYGSISSLSTAPGGKLYAGIFNTKALVFSNAALSTPVAVNGTAASTSAPALIAVYHANEDAHPDVSIWHRDGNVSVAVADSAGTSLTYQAKDAESLKKLGVLAGAAPDAVAASDIDQDGLDDFVIVKGGSLYILTNLGGGQFATGDPIFIPKQGPQGTAMVTPVSAIAIGDVSTDTVGAKDLVLVSKTNHLIAIMENAATLR